MRPLLLFLLFAVFLTANVSKWYVNLGPRLNYYVPPLLAWIGLTLVYLSRRPLVVPREIRALIWLNVAFWASMALTIPIILLGGEAELLGTSLRGLIANGINTAGIVVALLLTTRLTAAERSKVADFYLLAIGLCSLYTVGQAFGAYVAGLDLDRIVGDAVPLSSREPTSISEDRWGLSGRRFYRFTGLTGDANLNAATFLMALPVIYHQSVGRWKAPFIILGVGAVMIIAQSLSITVTPIMLLLLGLLTLRYRHHARLLTWTVVGGLVALGAYTWIRFSEVIAHVIAVRLSAGGTSSVHLRIAVDALRLWTEYPFGVGLNGFAVYSPDFSAHNSYLQNLVELGPLGLLVSVAVVLYPLSLALRDRRGFGFVALLALTALALSSVGHDLQRRFELALLANLWVGFAVMERREREQAAPRGGGDAGPALPRAPLATNPS